MVLLEKSEDTQVVFHHVFYNNIVGCFVTYFAEIIAQRVHSSFLIYQPGDAIKLELNLD